MPIVTIFGGSHVKEGEPDYELARELGKALAQAGYTVCNGGYGGIMEASARGAKEAGGRTIGVTTQDFGGPANLWIGEEIRMKKWAKRLFKLIELGDAYVVFDGGTGTLVELFVAWEMLNKKLIQKPLVIMGQQLHNVIPIIGKLPHVASNSNLVFKKMPLQAIEFLKNAKI